MGEKVLLAPWVERAEGGILVATILLVALPVIAMARAMRHAPGDVASLEMLLVGLFMGGVWLAGVVAVHWTHPPAHSLTGLFWNFSNRGPESTEEVASIPSPDGRRTAYVYRTGERNRFTSCDVYVHEFGSLSMRKQRIEGKGGECFNVARLRWADPQTIGLAPIE